MCIEEENWVLSPREDIICIVPASFVKVMMEFVVVLGSDVVVVVVVLQVLLREVVVHGAGTWRTRRKTRI